MASDLSPPEVELTHTPLLDHLGDDIDRSRLGSLTVEDFLCDDGFHPGRYGTAYIVSLIAASYAKISGIGHS